jgi:hypothetical protein
VASQIAEAMIELDDKHSQCPRSMDGQELVFNQTEIHWVQTMSADSPVSPGSRLRPIDSVMALHEILASVQQMSYMKEHCETLISQLDDKIRSTYLKAPVRKRAKATFELLRTERRDPIDRERYLEKLIWEQWGHDAVERGGQPFFGEACRFIQTYQMPLQQTREDNGWGRLDLVGVTADSMPVVIELKQEQSGDTPLRMLVEALAYACAFKKAWNKGLLATEWKDAMKTRHIEFTITSPIEQIPVILLAPASFWKRKIGAPGKRSSGKVPEAAWSPFRRLASTCQDHGFPVTFTEFDTESNGTDRERVSQGRKVSLPGFEEENNRSEAR